MTIFGIAGILTAKTQLDILFKFSGLSTFINSR